MSEDNNDIRATPSEVANFFLIMAREEKIPLTIMQLLKLVYIGYGWSLTILETELFDEQIQAWRFGPVIPSLYHEFKDFGPKPIDRLSLDIEFREDSNDVIKVNAPVINDNRILNVMSKVWQCYKNCSAFVLSDITHRDGSPWRKALDKANGRQNPPLDNADIIEVCAKKIRNLIAHEDI